MDGKYIFFRKQIAEETCLSFKELNRNDLACFDLFKSNSSCYYPTNQQKILFLRLNTVRKHKRESGEPPIGGNSGAAPAAVGQTQMFRGVLYTKPLSVKWRMGRHKTWQARRPTYFNNNNSTLRGWSYRMRTTYRLGPVFHSLNIIPKYRF